MRTLTLYASSNSSSMYIYTFIKMNILRMKQSLATGIFFKTFIFCTIFENNGSMFTLYMFLDIQAYKSQFLSGKGVKETFSVKLQTKTYIFP